MEGVIADVALMPVGCGVSVRAVCEGISLHWAGSVFRMGN